MTPQDPDALARRRFALLTLMKAGGVLLMLFAMWLWHGDVIPDGHRIGPILFAIGLATSVLLPIRLAKKWKTPPAA